ncbi:UNVERIFIED_CONTAM: AraC family transcriptional regulator [Methylobacteriaceae bacterium AG10]|nr:AraC family transcriptional regulator [Methylobacteriaceae bacterium AG10]
MELATDYIDSRIDQDTVVPSSVFRRYYNLKQIVFGEIEAPAQVMERSASYVAAQNFDHITLNLQVAGRAQITAANRCGEVGQEAFTITDMGQPIKLEITRARGLRVTLPRRLLNGWRGDLSDWHGRSVPSTDSPLTRLLANHLKSMAACLPTATPLQKELLASATASLCNAAFLGETDSAYDHAAVSVISMRQFIDQNLASVTAEMLMAKFGLSRTPLYKIFEKDGGVYAYIRNRRLAYAMQQLVRSGQRRPTIKQLTFACGFENEQVFSRAFRRKYGCNPSEVNATTLPAANWDRSSRYIAWLKDLGLHNSSN